MMYGKTVNVVVFDAVRDSIYFRALKPVREKYSI
jgi:hypothetical protein